MRHLSKRVLSAAILLAGLGLLFSIAPSERNTIAILAGHQDEMMEFLTLLRAESAQAHGDIQTLGPILPELVRTESTYFSTIYTEPDGTLVGVLADGDLFETDRMPLSSSAADAVWRQLCRGRFTDFSCSLAENGSMEARFYRSGKWTRYEEGRYRWCHILIWRDEDDPDSPGESWRYLSEQDGIAVSDSGAWYYSYEKEYDG